MSSFVDMVLDGLAPAKCAPKNFFERLPQEKQEEFLEVRRRLQSGQTRGSARQIAERLVEFAKRDGCDICGVQGVRAWLARKA